MSEGTVVISYSARVGWLAWSGDRSIAGVATTPDNAERAAAFGLLFLRALRAHEHPTINRGD